MRRRAPIALLAVCAAGSLALALVGAGDERELAFTTDVRVVEVVAAAAPGEKVCQRDIQSTAPFDTVELVLGTGMLPGPPLMVTVRDLRTREVLARGLLPSGARDNRPARARLAPEVEEGRTLEVCVLNVGARGLGFYGGPDPEGPGRASADRPPVKGDIRIVYLRSEPRSALSLAPDMFERASLFRPEPVGAWTFWLLLAAIAAGVPALLAAALRAALQADRERADRA